MQHNPLHQFGMKFIDVMIGIVLGLGFQWWPDLEHPWQYLAFIFVYLNLVDYWIDYGPTLKKYPLKREIDVILHTFLVFTMFFLIISTLQTVTYFLLAFILYRVGDLIWIYRMRKEFHIPVADRPFFTTWTLFDCTEILGALILFGLLHVIAIDPLVAFLVFATLRITTRVLASVRYQQFYFS